jgi:hypothetical protein
MAKGTIYEHREPTETELAWVTGIWEGEGSWSYKKGRTRTFANGKTYTEKDYLFYEYVYEPIKILWSVLLL